MMEDDEFKRGDISIQWLEQRLPDILARPATEDARTIAAIAAALAADRDRGARRPATDGTPAATVRQGAEPSDAWRRAARREGLRGS
jgi:acetyl-CoA carboxylase biotin carboxylase subunit